MPRIVKRMTTAKDELERIERTTDWPVLIEGVLSDVPNARPLVKAVNRWGQCFEIVYQGPPLEPDFPEPLRAFFRRLAAADFPPELLDWLESFRTKHGRIPATSDVPRKLRALMPTGKHSGRPRCDTQRWQAARRAWQAALWTESYEECRETIDYLGEELNRTFGFTQEDVRGARPHELALEKLSNETKLSPSRLQDIMGHRKRK